MYAHFGTYVVLPVLVVGRQVITAGIVHVVPLWGSAAFVQVVVCNTGKGYEELRPDPETYKEQQSFNGDSHSDRSSTQMQD